MAKVRASEPKIRVLLLEDNRLLREGIESMLNEQPDIEAVAATGDDDALELARKLKPQVLLLDLGLRSADSLKIVETLRREFPSTEVVVMDLIPVQAELAEYVRAGVSGFILKDATLDDFLQTIRAVAKGAKVLPPSLTGSLFSQIVEHALQSGKVNTLIESVRMTRREQDVIDLIAQGQSNKEIATQLNIAVHTVKSHVHNILEKLAIHSRLEVARIALSGPQTKQISPPKA